MQTRWFILFVLFFARTAMAFQFQSVAALSPMIIDSLALTLVDIGLLIGLYLGPGVIVATLGGTVAGWFGDRRVVLCSLGLMVAGGVIVAYATTMPWAIAGRVVSGAGGVVINVLMTKMVLDWFTRTSTATAMAIFISSWPLGIALALLVLPPLAVSGGIRLAWACVIAATVAALALFAVGYRAPEGGESGGAKLSMARLPWGPLAFAAVVWGLYNTAFAMMFGFGPLILEGRGFSETEAGSATSLFILAATVGIPLGGWVADRTGRRDAVIVASLIAGVATFLALLYLPVTYTVLVLLVSGLVVGLAPGPIVALPGEILPAHARAFGTGVFYSIYYVLMLIAPPLAGAIADWLGDVNVAFLLASAMSGAALLALAGFRATATRPAATR